MNDIIEHNERTAIAQLVTNQPDGPGRRIGKRGELTLIGNVLPGGAKLFRERLPQFQAEAAYWEERVGTVQEFRIFLFDDDTRYMLTVVYDGDFKAYLTDVATAAGAWLDRVGTGIFEGYPGLGSPQIKQWIESRLIPAEFFYASHPDLTVREVARMRRLSKALSDLLDSAG